jgi:type II restriction enzyme
VSGAITQTQIRIRQRWVELLGGSANQFAETSQVTANLLREDVDADGVQALVGHLRFCGCIPESYGHDSTQEKAYSKYTDSVISETLSYLGFQTIVLDGRADMADVEAVGGDFDLVADAKAFRLTRTAKNQKDFKVAAMDRWRYGKKYAAIVCPIDHLPARTSQIYLDASSRNVCILSYSHLAALAVRRASMGVSKTVDVMEKLLAVPSILNPSKDAHVYWQLMDTTLLRAEPGMEEAWRGEKTASVQALNYLKREGLAHLSSERSRIMAMSHDEAIQALIDFGRISAREQTIRGFTGSSLLDAGQ